jgi:hypothetical protein
MAWKEFRRKHIENIAFYLKRHGKSDGYLFLYITNFLSKYLHNII